MSTFENITITREANVYFEGKVTSRTLEFSDGEIKTLGIMMPGDYEFSTDKMERMEILAGDADIMLKEETQWRRVSAGESFEVPAHSSFKINAVSVVDYCCSYLDS